MRLRADYPTVGLLLAGRLAEGSPYLWDLCRREPERLAALLESDPDTAS